MKKVLWGPSHAWLDQGYTGSSKAWIGEHLGWTVEIVQHAPTERGESRYTQDGTGKLHGTYVRFAPELGAAQAVGLFLTRFH